MSRFLPIAIVGAFGAVFQAQASPPLVQHVQATSVGGMSPMPAVRRLGILPAHTNVAAFRTFLREDAVNSKGFLALPMTEEQVSRELSRMVVRASAASGRFWSLSLDALVELSGVAQSRKDYSAAELRLQKAYDLDAWIEPEVSFSPDHTKLRLTVRSSRDRTFILAREDVLFDAMPSGADIEKNFRNALARISSTLGHDGRVTWRKDNLVVVDFGKERGLAPGSQLGAGYVVLSARHPVSQEYLRSQKIETLELEVVEARDGSSLCKIQKRSSMMETEANNLVPGLTEKGVLAWRKGPAGASWSDFESSKAGAIVSGTEGGFQSDEPEVTVSQRENGASKPNSQEAKVAEKLKAVKAYPMPAQAEVSQGTDEAQDTQKSQAESPRPRQSEGEDESRGAEELPDFMNLSRWKPVHYVLGVGIAGGSLDTAGGTKSADVPPSSLLNSVKGSGVFTFSRLVYAEPQVSYHFWSDTIDGYRFEAELPIMYSVLGTVSNVGSMPGSLAFGAGPTLLIGQAKASYRLANRSRQAKQDFSAVDILLKGAWAAQLPQFGEVQAEVGVALLELFDDSAALDIRVGGHPFVFAPKPLGLYAGFRSGPGIWTGWNLGVSWQIEK
jgi:hypothetical protein